MENPPSKSSLQVIKVREIPDCDMEDPVSVANWVLDRMAGHYKWIWCLEIMVTEKEQNENC